MPHQSVMNSAHARVDEDDEWMRGFFLSRWALQPAGGFFIGAGQSMRTAG
jgi:hypothetical protein